MPLPQKVIEQLGHEPAKTQGWSYGMLLFAAAVFAIALVIYFGLTLGYEPYLNAQIANTNDQINTLAQSISQSDQASLLTFYSQIVNVQSVLANHITFSRFLTWLESNTESNVYFSHITFASGSQVSLTGVGISEADVNEQIAIFQNAPAVQSMNVSNVALAGVGSSWNFTVTLTMNPAAVFLSAASASATTTVATTTSQ